jgi:hypothetical protein
MSLPRGIRNNQPGNIRISNIPWKGKVPFSENTDGSFEQCYRMVDGIRMLMKDIITKIGKYHTVEGIISVYAPSNENDTGAYIKSVCDRTGFERDEVLTPDEETIKKLVYAISYHENGGDYLKIGDVEDAWKLI